MVNGKRSLIQMQQNYMLASRERMQCFGYILIRIMNLKTFNENN